MKTLILSVLLLSFSANAAESVVNVTELNQILKKSNATWTARESWVTKMSVKDAQSLLGSLDVPEESIQIESAVPGQPSTDKHDWRNVNGINWLGPVMNQGNCGSCVAFATVATAEAQYAISAGFPFLRPTFSTNNLFACGGGSCSRGWMPESAARYVVNNGLVDEACSPYYSGSNGFDGVCEKETCSNAKDRTVNFKGYNHPSIFMGYGFGDGVKAALKKGPLVTTMRVYADFIAYAGGIYKHVNGKMLGGHAVSIVGFDDVERVWIIRNSWGTEWGEKGFARISYDDNSGIANSTWGLETEPKNGYVSVLSPKDNDYVSGNVSLQSSVLVKSGVNPQTTFFLSGENGTVSYGCSTLSTTGCKSLLNTSSLKEGRYEIFSETKAATTAPIRSQVRSFTVINSVPRNLSISFYGADVDLGKPLKERIEFYVKTASLPVPMRSITFIVKDLSGKVVASRRQENVLPVMKTGWRTYMLPNGTYDISFAGELPYNGKIYSYETPAKRVIVENDSSK